MAFLSQSDKNSGCYGNLQLPLTNNGQKLKMAFIAISLQVFWLCLGFFSTSFCDCTFSMCKMLQL